MSRGDQLGFSLVELADATDLSPRTIHYYSSQGLLPAADRRGAGARYPRVTLDRLRAILRFKNEARLTLQEIRRILSGLSEEQITRVASGASTPYQILDEAAGAPPNGRGAGPETSASPPATGAARHGMTPDGTAGVAGPAHSVSDPYRPGPGRPAAGPAAGTATDPTGAGVAVPSAEPEGDLPTRDFPRVGGEATEQLASLLRTLELGAGRAVPRAGSRDHWVSIPITADLQISAHRVSGEDIEKLRRIADHIRALLVAGFAGNRGDVRRRPTEGPSGPSSQASPGA
ncbi:MAG: MerR family transcriptional regulator [Candidatus Eisenbacteria bacterium]